MKRNEPIDVAVEKLTVDPPVSLGQLEKVPQPLRDPRRLLPHELGLGGRLQLFLRVGLRRRLLLPLPLLLRRRRRRLREKTHRLGSGRHVDAAFTRLRPSPCRWFFFGGFLLLLRGNPDKNNFTNGRDNGKYRT